jgi:DNA-binding LytR/AlgR family response regulator
MKTLQNFTKTKLVIIEDEPLAADRLQKQLEKLAIETEVLVVLESVSQATKWFMQNPAPDLVLSDIQLGDGISFQIFEKQLVTCPIIFTTSYDEFAIRAFKVQSIDYLLKPVKQEELERAFHKFQAQQKVALAPWEEFQQKIGLIMNQIEPTKGQYRERFVVKQADQLIPVSTNEIAYFFTRNDWVCLSTHAGKQHIIDFKLEELGEMVDPKLFFRLNRQFLAAASSIQKAHNHLNGKLKLELHPAPEDEVFVSREKAQGFKSWWEG